MTDEQNIDSEAALPSQSPHPQRNLQCRFCQRTLGSVSLQSGAVVPSDVAREPCETCHRFEELHAAVTTSELTYEVLRYRRREYKPRSEAIEALDNARMEFANFMLQVEHVGETHEKEQAQEQSAPVVSIVSGAGDGAGGEAADSALERTTHTSSATVISVATAQSATDAAAVPGEPESSSRGKKRARPSTSASDDGLPPDVQASGSRKRVKLDLSGSRLRVTFDPSLSSTEMEEQRSIYQLRRGSTEYRRGRFATPEGEEHLDTSGFLQSFSAFHRVRKVRGMWVPLPEKDGDVEELEEGEVEEEEIKEEIEEEHDESDNWEDSSDEVVNRTELINELVESMSMDQLQEMVSPTSPVSSAHQRAIRRQRRESRRSRALSPSLDSLASEPELTANQAEVDEQDLGTAADLRAEPTVQVPESPGQNDQTDTTTPDSADSVPDSPA